MNGISVVMGTYNGARHIREQLQSIIDQAEPPDEVVVCDDGSTDETLDIVADVSRQTDIPVRVYRNETNLGYADNFLRAATLAQGRYVAFSDQDDRWLPTKLSTSYRALVDHDAVMAIHPMRLMSADGLLVESEERDGGVEVIPALTSDPFGVNFGFTMVIDRSTLLALPAGQRGQDTYDPQHVLSHDRWAYFLATNLGRIVNVREPLVDYRQHDGQLYGSFSVGLVQRFRNKVREGPAKLQATAETAALRARLLTESPLADEPAWRAAAHRWQRLQEFCQRRHDLYVAPRLLGRIRLVIVNVRRGAYRSFADAGLGPKRLIEDLTLGLFGRYLAQW